MLLGGDEFGRTQNGNNNAYCHDDELSWFDWSALESDAGQAMTDFTRRCIAARAEHPTLHLPRFYTGHTEVTPGLMDASWFDETGNGMTPEMWQFAEGRMLMLRRVAQSEGGRVSATLLLLNAYSEEREFTLPEPVLDWEILVDAAEKIAVEEKPAQADAGAAEVAEAEAAPAPAEEEGDVATEVMAEADTVIEAARTMRAVVDNRISVAAHSAVLLGVRNIKL
jgi:glycogen operon protein